MNLSNYPDFEASPVLALGLGSYLRLPIWLNR